MKRLFAIALASVCALSTAFAAVEFPAADGFVTDVSSALSAETETTIETRLTAYERETGTEIAVAIIPNIPDEMSANEYATALGNAWGVGKARADTGALLLIETDDEPGQRDVYIATGSQTEGGLTDLESHAITDEVIVPRFAAGDFDGGVTAGVEAIIAALAGESFTDLRMENAGSENPEWGGLVIFGIIALQWLAAILGRSKAIWPGAILGGIGGGALALFLTTNLIAIFASVIALALLGLGFDALVSSDFARAKTAGNKPHWWAGGGGFGGGRGGGFGGFGGGGFSGGGGGSRW